MSVEVGNIKSKLKEALVSSLVDLGDFSDKVQVEVSDDILHGIFTTNIAMTLARELRMSPRDIAQVIVNNIDLTGTMLSRCEVAGPGFVNFFPSDDFFSAVLMEVNAKGRGYGCSNYGNGKKVQVEFVSANPTGPMHLGNARGGALGDCLSAVLKAAGYDVSKEFYINDAGNQIDKFAKSLNARYLQLVHGDEYVDFPEDGYHGDDIRDLAREYVRVDNKASEQMSDSDREKALVKFALPYNVKKMRDDLQKYKIEYDNWFYESDLHKNGEIAETINILRDNGFTYERDGALWYNATKFGAEKDEVLIRANGVPTYFAADIAYHRNKFIKRRFDICIDVWGADHHGHVARMKGAMQAIGINPDRLDIVLMQLVRLVRNGEVVRMSKRTGKAIQLEDLLDEVSVDAARFIFNSREASSQMDFDLDLAVKEDSQNPVYYVQYAYARICSIEKTLSLLNNVESMTDEKILTMLKSPEEIHLIRQLFIYTEEIELAAKSYNPSRVTRYVIDLATAFHRFYNACKVKCDDTDLMNARLCLCKAVRIVIKNVLDMFKVNTPEFM